MRGRGGSEGGGSEGGSDQADAEEPDRTEESAPDRLPGELPDPPFRTPDPEDVGRRSEG